MQGASQGVTAAASRPRFSSSDGEGSEDDLTSNGEIASSDLGKISETILGTISGTSFGNSIFSSEHDLTSNGKIASSDGDNCEDKFN